jgi:hypothetical protein
MPMLRSPIFLFVFALLVASCKDDDVEPPTVAVSAPQENEQFSVFDTIDVFFQAMDDQVVESVTVKLVDATFAPVSAQLSVVGGDRELNGHAALVITDRQLTTGSYFVLVTASDGTNDRSAYREVRIVELPFERRAVFVTTSSASGMGSVFRLDSLFSYMSMFVATGQDIGRSYVDSERDRLTICGSANGGMVHYDLALGGVRWSASAPQQSSSATYHDMVGYDGSIFVSLFDREFRGYTSEGALIVNKLTESDRPFTLFANEAHLLVERRQVGGSIGRLFVYRNGNFSLKHELNLSSMQVVAFCERTADEVFIFGNLNGQAKLWLYDMENNAYWEPRQLPEGRLLHAVKGEGQTYYLAHETGLYHYTFSPNYLNTIRSGVVYQRLVFDRADGYLFAASGHDFDVIAGQQGAVVSTFALADSITSMDVHYTK